MNAMNRIRKIRKELEILVSDIDAFDDYLNSIYRVGIDITFVLSVVLDGKAASSDVTMAFEDWQTK